MNITSEIDARSLAAFIKTEKDRAYWLRQYASAPEEQRSLTNAYFDELASQVVTQTLCDVVCSAYPEVC